MKNKLNPFVLSESRFGHQLRGFLVLCGVSMLTLPRIEGGHWNSPLFYVELALSFVSLIGIVGYPLYWLVALLEHHPVIVSAGFVAGGLVTLVSAPSAHETSQFASYLVVALALFGAAILKFLSWVTQPEQNKTLEAIDITD